MPVYLELFHGRKTVTEELDDWGVDGPILGPFDYVHTTYSEELKVGNDFKGRDGVLSVRNDLVYYDGMYYGDWSVFDEAVLRKGTEKNDSRLQQFDADKAKLPKLEDGGEFVCARCHKFSTLDKSVKWDSETICQECHEAVRPHVHDMLPVDTKQISYCEDLDADQQVTMEELIAARIFDHESVECSEGDAQELGRDILKLVLYAFRSDLIVEQDKPEETEAVEFLDAT